MDRALRTFPRWPVLIAVGLACGAPAVRAPALALGDEITLYRDRAVIRTRVEVAVPDADQAIVTLRVPAETDIEDVVILDRGDLTVTQKLAPTEHVVPMWKRDPRTAGDDGAEVEAAQPEAPAHQPPARATGPKELRFVVTAPRAGRYSLGLGYATEQLSWDAAYTVTITPARTEASVRGTIAIRNATGMTFSGARTFVVDGDLGLFRARADADEKKEEKRPAPRAKEGAAPVAIQRPLGALTLGAGETRVELLPGDRPRSVRSVLVYDPIGTKLDHADPLPIRDPKLGIEDPSPRVRESLEIVRPKPSTEGLPGGPARLLERRADGTLVSLGEARLFDVSTSIAPVDILELGTADGVSGQRERREFSLDNDRKRLVEEFAVTIANTRARPIEVMLREHLYRGQNWALAYYTGANAKKDGAQQISVRLRVPANGEAKLFYVVVYTWQ